MPRPTAKERDWKTSMQHETEHQIHQEADLQDELLSALTYLGYVANSISLNMTAILIRVARGGVQMEHRLRAWKLKCQRRT